MIARPAAMRRTRQQGGYALLMIMFLLALLVLATMAVAPNVLTEGRREKEEEMIWRGNQYVRGIRLYVTKNRGKFPTALDDLTTPKTGIRFMRQAYKDPMNKEDGAWRLIYVGPAGQVIGSLRPQQRTLQIPAVAAPQAGTPASSLSGQGSPASGQSGQPGASSGQAASGQPAGAPGAADANPMSTPQSLNPSEGLTIIGGNIIGVGSKINKRSIKWYDKAKNYRQFEFIWDPAKDAAVAVAQPPNVPIAVPGEAPPASQQSPANQPNASPNQQP